MKKRNISLILILLLVVSLSFFFIFNKSTNKKENIKKQSNKTNVVEKKEEAQITQKETYGNTDIIGNIKIEGTDIDEYIVQTTDNDYYLKHNLKKEYDIAGAVFMDYRNSIDDKKILIFGHNARKLETVPFHDLEKYLDKDFYNNNKYIDLKLGDEDSKWLIFSVMIVKKGDNTHMKLEFNDDTWMQHLNYLKSNSIYNTGVDIASSDKIVVIQTCNYNPENTYILVCAKRI